MKETKCTCTIDKVIFCNSNAGLSGGGLAVSNTDQLTLSNCVFEKCGTAVSSPIMGGGGMHMSLIPSLRMDSVLFRRCSSRDGNDIYINIGVGTIEELLPKITNCDSTSERPNVFFDYSSGEDSILIPAVPDASTASLVTIENTPSVDQTSSTIQMTVSQNVNGKMLVLVDNTNNHEPPNDDSPPTIGRLLTFDFSTSTESATQEVSCGEWEELQYESEYCVIAASIANARLSNPSSIALTTPNPARIVQIVCSLGSGTDHCWLQLKGRTLPIGRYTVKLVAVPELTFSVEFDGSKGGPNTLNMFSSRHSETLFGTGSKMTFSTKYEVESVTFDDNEPVILDPPRLFFTTPEEQPRLISVGPVSFKNESTKDTILIPLVAGSLPNGQYVLKLRSSSSEDVSFTVTFSSSDSETIEVVVSSKDSSDIKLKYGMTYTVKEITSETTNCLIDKALSIEIPDEPKRIEEGRVTLNGAKTEATLRLKGRMLTDGIYSLKLKSVSSIRKSEAILNGDEELLFKVPISTASSSILTFGTTYTISSLKLASDDVIVNSDVELAVPNPPTATMTSCDLDAASNSKFTLTLTGLNLPTSGSFLVSFVGLTQTIVVTMNSIRGSSSLIEVTKTTEIKFGQTYTISSIVEKVDGKEDEHILCSGLTMTTPDGPSLLNVDSATLKVDDLNRVVLDVSFVDMAAGSFVMKVRNTNTLLEYTLSSPIVTTLGSVTGALTELVYKSGKLEYGTSYTIVSLESSTLSVLIKDTAEFTVPDEPKRIEEGRVTLNGAKDEATVRLKGRALTDGSYTLTLNSVSSELTSEASLSEDGELLFKVPISLLPTSILAFGQNYTISSLKFGSDNVVVNSDVKLAVPNPPIVKTATVHPNSINTTMAHGLAGTDLELDGFYFVTLTPLFSFDMLFNSSTTALSAELLLGRADCLQHNTEYTIESITRIGDDSDVIPTMGTVSFTTPKLSVPLVLHVNRKEGKEDTFCGESDDPCSTIDFAWSIVSSLKAKFAILAIVNSSEQIHPITISSGMSILFSNGGTLEPTLTIPSSASMGNKAGMVVVDNAGFEVIDVTIKIESTDPSFVFLSATKSTVILKEGSFVGEPLPTVASNSESENICSWDSGIVQLDASNTTINRMTFSSISQGAIQMKNGTLTFRESSFDGNSPNLDSFPSARQNIRCVEGGNVTIGSLSGGDGYGDHPSAWISTTDCILKGDDSRPDSPLFIPSLSSKSTSSFNKKEKRFSVTIVGTMMIPCGLCLEVFEIKKDKSEGKSEKIELSLEKADSFNETHINLLIPLTSLSSLDKTADRMAESSLVNMKWWLPLVIVLLCCALVVVIVVVVILRRRKQQKAQKGLETQQESQNEMEEEKIEVEQIDNEGVNAMHTSVDGLKGGTLNPERKDESTTKQTQLIHAPPAECVSVLDCTMLETKEMPKMETLFDRLHRNKKGLLDKRAKQIELTRGLQKLGKLNPHADVLLHLSSHWILIDVDGRLSIQMNQGPIPSNGGQSQVNHTTVNESVLPDDSRLMSVTNENADGMDRVAKLAREKEDQEDQRWQAPEQGGNNSIPSSDLEKVMVFRLGLVLWEIETGQVPFRETDGVNAGRQLRAGVKPNMEIVQNKEMKELLLKCLELQPIDRIALDNVISSLNSIPDDPVQTQHLFGT
ncbi:hypothetical protein BLNAU_19074 [Blattamonas nauphoetae]|uniref:Protein kinase domain-containing protein n=1 Tax=Blattamonas nauphoetae TaxID=2049346 RepID=A0ABQ9X2J7_9EUKA|nr:hypothetical protein BLNAU_19074 [Blattamonas nauphoetae]